jgi:RimJ/RimL family protein N-acetyltransferase
MSIRVVVAASGAIGELVLRPWTADDVHPLIEAYRDPTLRRWTRVPVTDEVEAEAWLAEQARGSASGRRLSFAVDEFGPGGARLVGNVVLKPPGTTDEGRAEVGYWTAAPARGRGVASRAVDALSAWAFGSFSRLDRLELLHHSDNPASCRVAERAGYAFASVVTEPPPGTASGHLHVRRRTRPDAGPEDA